MIRGSAERGGAAVRGALGSFAGGPEGAADLGAAGLAASKAFTELCDEISDRLVVHREKQRIGWAFGNAAGRIRVHLEGGESQHDDEFFDKGPPRAQARRGRAYAGDALARQRC